MIETTNSKTAQALALAKEITTSWFWPLEVEQPEPNRLDVKLASADDLVSIVTAMRVKRLGYLSAITGLDPGLETEQLEVLYHFCAGAAVITLRVPIPRHAPVVPSLSQIVPSAEVFERELKEMFGVTVSGLPTPEHLYLPDDWPDATYPLRKDFDLASIHTTTEGER
ncbi:MAG: NADH-quinone oxidoreductase subunit C [Chloroflexota bacterium]|jgi:Ni,Fe-hydrogenase III component G